MSSETIQPLDLDALTRDAPPGPYTVHSIIGGREIHATHADRTLAMHVAPDVAPLLAASRTMADELRETRAQLRDALAYAASGDRVRDALADALAYAASADALRCDECGALATRSARYASEHGCDAHAHPEWPDLPHAATLREVMPDADCIPAYLDPEPR